MADQTRKILDRDEVSDVLQGAFYAPLSPPASAETSERASTRKRRSSEVPKEDLHYKVICISLYNDDLERLDGMVEQLKARGLTKASRSALIRIALDQVDLSKIRRGL